MPAARLIGQITLGDGEVPRMQDLERQILDQKFPLNLARRNVMGTGHPQTQLISASTAKNYRARHAEIFSAAGEPIADSKTVPKPAFTCAR
jgi:hypothetical protein